MTTNNETIAEIVSDMRVYAKNSKVNGGEVDVWNWLADYADRIEAAHKREREAGAEAAQICCEIGEMIGREAAGRQPVTDCNRLGNAAKDDERLTIVANYETVIADKDAVIAELRERIKIAEDALEKIDNMCDGDMCKFFDNTHHCSACRYLESCQTGVAHAALAVIRGN